MKLDQECVRSILLELEENLASNDYVLLDGLKKYDSYKTYGEDQLVYSIRKLIEAGYLNGSTKPGSNTLIHLGVTSLTWDGHLFLDNIRDDGVWKETKNRAIKISSSVSIKILADVAASYLKSTFGI